MQDTADRPYHHGNLRRTVIDTAMAMLHEEQELAVHAEGGGAPCRRQPCGPLPAFPDKAALLSEMTLLGFDRLREALTAAKPARPQSIRDEFLTVARAYVRFGTSNPALYRLMFGGDEGKAADVHLNERALAAFGVLLELLERGQAKGVLAQARRARPGSSLLGADAWHHHADHRRPVPAREGRPGAPGGGPRHAARRRGGLTARRTPGQPARVLVFRHPVLSRAWLAVAGADHAACRVGSFWSCPVFVAHQLSALG